MNQAKLPVRMAGKNRLLTAAEFHQLADVPAEVEWFENIENLNTRRSYKRAVGDFIRFTGIRRLWRQRA
jgi:hypothetical protein